MKTQVKNWTQEKSENTTPIYHSKNYQNDYTEATFPLYMHKNLKNNAYFI